MFLLFINVITVFVNDKQMLYFFNRYIIICFHINISINIFLIWLFIYFFVCPNYSSNLLNEFFGKSTSFSRGSL